MVLSHREGPWLLWKFRLQVTMLWLHLWLWVLGWEESPTLSTSRMNSPGARARGAWGSQGTFIAIVCSSSQQILQD